MDERCSVCGVAIRRDVLRNDGEEPTSAWFNVAWFGVCGCANRKWRWRSTTGEPPWELTEESSVSRPSWTKGGNPGLPQNATKPATGGPRVRASRGLWRSEGYGDAIRRW